MSVTKSTALQEVWTYGHHVVMSPVGVGLLVCAEVSMCEILALPWSHY